MKKSYLCLKFICTILFVACTNDTVIVTPYNENLVLNLNGLEPLGSDFVYEAWIAGGNETLSLGTFSETTFPLSFTVNPETLFSARSFKVTIELANNSSTQPSNTEILRGFFSERTAYINTSVIGDFESASGTFFLKTPTDDIDDRQVDNDQNGIWFGMPGSPPSPNINLPNLPSGWIYEGWVTGESGYISTGKFRAFNAVDHSNKFSGITNNNAFDLPGEDFFVNAPAGESFPLDIKGRNVFISVEPVPDNSPDPFLIRPLVGKAGTATAPAMYYLKQNIISLPWGIAERVRNNEFIIED